MKRAAVYDLANFRQLFKNAIIINMEKKVFEKNNKKIIQRLKIIFIIRRYSNCPKIKN
jgi:hypothetical protein